MEPETAEDKTDLGGTFFSMLTSAKETEKRRRTFYVHISIVPVDMTPYQLGISWRSWMLMELFGCWMTCLCCFLLQTALGSVTGTRTKGGHCVVLTRSHCTEHQI